MHSSRWLTRRGRHATRSETLTAAETAADGLAAGVREGSTDTDFCLLLSRETLAAVIGGAPVDALEHALGGIPAGAIAVRRTAATGRWIGLHCDAAARTLQVPLSDDDACTGGRLVYAWASGELEAVPRRAGVPVVHDGH